MKKITVYVNTNRVHWLVEELGLAGIGEIMVTEYFSPTSVISKMEMLCEDAQIERARAIVHRLGTTGSPCDHFFSVSNHEPYKPASLPLGRRMSPLED